MKFKLITADAPEYEAERLLRWEVLAKPHGIPPESDLLTEELQSLHLIALEGKKLVGSICFHPEGKDRGRIFEIAVSEEYQGNGFGRQLLRSLEQTLVDRGIQSVYVYAKPESEEFYSLMGYTPEGNGIVQMGQRQQRMEKHLSRD